MWEVKRGRVSRTLLGCAKIAFPIGRCDCNHNDNEVFVKVDIGADCMNYEYRGGVLERA